MIVLDKLCCGYGRDTVVHDVNLSFEAGKLYSIIGKNGCGKSTLLMTAAGLMKPFSGSITADGTDISAIKPKELARKFSFLPQSGAGGDITVRALVSHGRFPYLPYPRRYSAEDLRFIDSALEMLGITELADRKVSGLSGGQKQKVRIAMLIAQDTDVIFLDEPTTYLDIGARLELMELFSALAAKGRTVIMTLHDLDLAFRCSDGIAVMKNGSVISFAPPGETAKNGSVESAFGVSAFRDEHSGQYFFTSCSKD